MTRRYFDHAAATTIRPEVAAVMTPLLGGGHNPSSLHAEGRAARAIVDDARATVARVLRCEPREVIFTSGGTEADTLAILGAARARTLRGTHVVTSATEHPAVLRACDRLERDGWQITRLPVDGDGRIEPDAFARALTERTTLASIMLGNNETGVIAPIAGFARTARERGVAFHTDAVQCAGWLPLDVDALGVDLLSLSAHKVRGPSGVGALFVRRGTPLDPLLLGGGQEHGLRAGTENLAGIAGFARALELAEVERAAAAVRVGALRDRLEAAILGTVPGSRVNGAGAERLPHIASFAFSDVPGDALLMRLDLEGIAASAGSACAAGALEPSHVVAALGLDPAYRNGVIRFSLGSETRPDDVEEVVRRLPALVADVRLPATVR